MISELPQVSGSPNITAASILEWLSVGFVAGLDMAALDGSTHTLSAQLVEARFMTQLVWNDAESLFSLTLAVAF